MRVVLSIVLCCIAASLARADVPAAFAGCLTLEQCMHALDARAPARSHGGSYAEDAVYAERLERFGDAAKQELLKRASGSDRHWTDLAGAILMHWKAFDARDVPALIAGLHAEPSGWLALPLERIGTPEALQALADDVRAHDAMGQSGWALAKAGPRALPYVLSLLDDGKKVADARFILKEMKDGAAADLDAWLAIARDEKAPEEKRLAALRGIGILGTRVKQVAPDIRKISDQARDDAMEALAVRVLEAMGDASVVGAALECKRPPGEGWHDADECLSRAAAYGRIARPYANWILVNFAASDDGELRAAAASALGYIGYAEADARLREMLHDPDWRVVYAASRALGWLGAKDALADLQGVAATHWLEAVRGEARAASDALRSSAGALARPATRDGTLDDPPDVDGFIISARNAPDTAPCGSGHWRWNGKVFGAPDNSRMALDVAAPHGRLTGSDHGEWGGEFVWHPPGGEKILLSLGNVEGIEAVPGGGAIVVFGGGGAFLPYDPDPPKETAPNGEAVETLVVSNGPAGSGWAMLARPDASGAWRMSRIAVFPRAVDALAAIDDGVYAAWSGNRAVVFTPEGVRGLAACAAG